MVKIDQSPQTLLWKDECKIDVWSLKFWKQASSLILVLIFLLSCNDRSKETPPLQVQGFWKAKWITPSQSYQGVQGITAYEMDGSFTFDGDSLIIEAYGYPGCVFGIDTIRHGQNWKIVNDSLILIGVEGQPGIGYQINSRVEDQIQLQLMDDIMVTLSR